MLSPWTFISVSMLHSLRLDSSDARKVFFAMSEQAVKLGPI